MDSQLIAQANVSPNWLPGGHSFWYRRLSEFVFVDIANKTRQGGFDHVALAEHLERLTKQTTDPESLLKVSTGLEESSGPLKSEPLKGSLLREEIPSPYAARTVDVRFVNRGTRPLTLEWINHAGDPVSRGSIEGGKSGRRVTWGSHVWRLTADKDAPDVKAVYAAPKDEKNDVVVWDEQEGGVQVVDSNTEFPKVFVRDFNVWVANTDADGDARQITSGATKDYPYDEDRVYTSPDRRYAVVWQYTPEQEHKVHLVESSPTDQLQPKLKTLQYLRPGHRVRIDRPRLFSLDQQGSREVLTDDLLFKNPYNLMNVGWGVHGNEFEYRFIFNQRGHQHLRVLGINQRGDIRVLVEETSKTFIDFSNKLYWCVVDRELLWASERDGWNHLYLYDLENGTLKNQITKGEWVVNEVDKIDQKTRRIWFRGNGMVAGQDPYYAQLARINFDGSGLKILTEGDGTHTWKRSLDGDRYLIDTWSRVDQPPTTVLRDGETGEHLITLEETQSCIPQLLTSGWTRPERFAAPGRDGKTMIYGVIVRPCDSKFDPTKKYPVLEYIYAGPGGSKGVFTDKKFFKLEFLQVWADRGYISVVLDGMGTNWRSKAFHDVCYKQLHDAGLPDRIAWIKAAAETRPWMDVSRVGIRGTSAGGQNAASAVLFHGDFYKAAAADSGCHDNRMDKLWWGEQWLGWPVDDSYEKSSNVVNAAKLPADCNLMLIVGDLDDILDPNTTLQFVNALNKAEKMNYEFLFIPGGKHGAGHSDYGQERQSDFFRRHLQLRER